MELLPESFAARAPAVVARALLGQLLVHGDVVLRITETEAYGGPGDTASHAHRGPTPRNRPMFGPPGCAYVYLCYGIHNLVNVTADRPGTPAAVLVRAAEPVAGLPIIRRRRGDRQGPVLLTGPGKVGAALGVDTGFSAQPLWRAGGLELRRGTPPSRVAVGPRIGIGYADDRDQAALLRFADADSRWVSHRRRLVGTGQGGTPEAP